MTESTWWVLDENGEPKPVEMSEWVKGGKTTIDLAKTQVGEAKVSTIFLTVNAEGKPRWETMIFGGKYDYECFRTEGNKAKGLKQHERIVEALRNNRRLTE